MQHMCYRAYVAASREAFQSTVCLANLQGYSALPETFEGHCCLKSLSSWTQKLQNLTWMLQTELRITHTEKHTRVCTEVKKGNVRSGLSTAR